MIENAWRGGFWMWAQTAGIPELNITPEQGKQLARETELTLRSLGTRRAKKFQKAINTYLPGASLVITALVLIVPRYSLQQRYKREYLGHVHPASPGGTAGQNGTVADTVAHGASATGDAPFVESPAGPAPGFREAPITGDDIDRLIDGHSESGE